MRFLHAADLHLDTPVTRLRSYPEAVGRVLRDASLDAFDNLVDVALARSVSFCLFAGDVYDGVERGTRAQLRFRDGLGRLSDAGIRSFVVHGNHDPVDEGWTAVRRWPELVTIFEPDRVRSVSFEADGIPVTVHGISYGRRDETENLSLRFPREHGPGVQIGLLHANVGARGGVRDYAPATVDDLRSAGIDYWALGHVHVRQNLSEHDPWIVYPGNLQARRAARFDAVPKGAVTVEVLPGGAILEPEFVPVDVVRFAMVDVPIDGLPDVAHLHDRLTTIAADLAQAADGRSIIVRASLTGRGPLHRDLARGTDDLHAELEPVGDGPFVWWDHFEVGTAATVDLDLAESADDLLGGVLSDLSGTARGDVDALLATLPRDVAVLARPDLIRLVRRSRVLAHDVLDGAPS